MKNKFLLFLISFFAFTLLIGTTYSAWVFSPDSDINQVVNVTTPDWQFFECDPAPNSITLDKISNCSYLQASQETTILSPMSDSTEAVRLTNTAGTQTKAHSFNITFDQSYLLRDIKWKKIDFDYYHAEKRQQAGKGFPKVHLLSGNVTKGSDQGGTDNVTATSPFLATNLGDNWWHLEYFITALCPTMVDHGDTPISESTVITGVKITDSAIYDYNSKTAFIVIDNLNICSSPSPRLGLFNRTTSFSAGGYYWVKVCWSGEIQSVTFTFSDNTIAEHDTESTKSPFYIKGLKKGKVTATAIVTLNGGQVLSISNNLTVT